MREGAREEGKAEGRMEIALKMLRKGTEIDTIVEFTGISKDELLKLQKDMKLD